MGLVEDFTENFRKDDVCFSAPFALSTDGVEDGRISLYHIDFPISVGDVLVREIDGEKYTVQSFLTGNNKCKVAIVKKIKHGITISILGTSYTITKSHSPGDDRLENKDGFCDETVHEIVVETYEGSDGKPDSKAKLDVQRNKVLRHEIVHAFLCESGLAENSRWAQDEEMVDWIAIQGPKIFKAWQEAGAL